MRIAAALCWYDEPIEYLERVIASVAPHVDCIVALDGAWEGFPTSGNPCSGADQHHALHMAIESAGIPDEFTSSSGKPWPSQSAKRTALYQAASERADWVLVIDADEELRVDRSALRNRIEQAERHFRPDAINLRVATPGVGMGGAGTATAPGGVRYQPRLLRADAFLSVGPHSHRTLTTERAVIQCDNDADAREHAAKVAGRIVTLHGASIINRTHSRSAERIAAKHAYGKARAERGID